MQQLYKMSYSRKAIACLLYTSHRLTTVQKATTIWVLTKDGIVEEGNHEELLAKKGIYYHLYYAWCLSMELGWNMDQLLARFTRYLEVERNASINTVTAYQKDIEDFIAFMNEGADCLLYTSRCV